jgi:hypothetical protein
MISVKPRAIVTTLVSQCGTITSWKNELPFSPLGYPPHRIDIVTALSGVDFAEAWKVRTEGELGGAPVHFIGKTALLANKAASGRPKDLADLDALS